MGGFLLLMEEVDLVNRDWRVLPNSLTRRNEKDKMVQIVYLEDEGLIILQSHQLLGPQMSRPDGHTIPWFYVLRSSRRRFLKTLGCPPY